jgi:hypothetical protein
MRRGRCIPPASLASVPSATHTTPRRNQPQCQSHLRAILCDANIQAVGGYRRVILLASSAQASPIAVLSCAFGQVAEQIQMGLKLFICHSNRLCCTNRVKDILPLSPDALSLQVP